MIDPNFPLIDLHRHLEGKVRTDTIIELAQKHDIKLPTFDRDELRRFVTVTEPQPGVMAFIEKLKWIVEVLVDYDACWRYAYENVIDAKYEGIDYLELRFSPWFMAETRGLNPEGVVEAVADGVSRGIMDAGIMVNLIGIISRTYGPLAGMKELEALMTKKDDIVALDLAGDEYNFPGELFVEHFGKARDLGWGITVHAGEAAGAESVWQAINELGAERIGHGVRIQEDATLMDFIHENGIGIEANLTSNVQTSTVPDLESHPLKNWLDMGLLATINSDDPSISDIDLPNEYNNAAPSAGLSQDQILQAQRNSLEIAFISKEEKKELLDKKRK